MAFADPDKNVGQLGIFEGMHIADFGSGSGRYAIALARRAGESGRVYAVDIQEGLLSALKKDAVGQGLLNVEVVRGDFEKPYGSKIADASVDAVLLSNILFQITDKSAIVKEARRILRQKGRAIIIDWSDSFAGLGPTEHDVVTKEEARSLLERNGFVLGREFDAGEHHYGLIFSKA